VVPEAAAEPVVPAQELLAGLPEQTVRHEEKIVVTVPESPYDDEEPPGPGGGIPPNLYGPFYGGPYVPTPVLDRHRTRVKS
jgi:hypothetical protein